MATVASILKNKGKNVYSVTPQSTIIDALKLMDEKKIGAVLVMEGDCLGARLRPAGDPGRQK